MRATVLLVLMLTAQLEGARTAHAQQPPRILEAADLKSTRPGAEWTSVGVLPNGFVRIHNASLRTLVATAYGVADSLVTGGAGWVDSDRYDIVVQLTPAPRDSVLAQLQRVLATRFRLAVTHAPKRDTVFALTVATNGPRLMRTANPGEPACPSVDGPPAQIHRGCHSFSMSDLATLLPQVARAYVTLPAVDLTNLEGSYDFQLDWMSKGAYDAAVARKAAGGAADPLAVSIFEAVDRLGLSLARRELLTDAVVIASATRPNGITRAAATGHELTARQVADIDRYLSEEIKREHAPGIEVGVYRNGEILLAKGYGSANVELNVPVTAATVFQSGSVGKQFASAAVMMLVEEGKMNLDESITKYFPDAPDWWKPILVKNLLSHTSGLAEYETGERMSASGPFYLRLDFSESELARKIEALPMEARPGDLWNYRNTNYVLLGIIIHKVTGKPYTAMLKDRIFTPWSMSATRPISDLDIVPNRSAGYEWNGRQLRNQDWVSPTFNSTADGTLYFNVLDIAKWDEALYGTSLLKQTSLDRMWSVYPLNNGSGNPAHYGFAWIIDAVNGHRVISHSGSWQGFTCVISRFVDDSITVVVLTNLAQARPGLMVSTVAGIVNPALAPPAPKLRKAIALDPKIFDGYVGAYQRSPTIVLTITRTDSHYFAQLTGQDPIEIFPETQRDFFLKVVDAQLTFITDAAGRAVEVVLHQNGTESHLKRIGK